MLYLEAPFYYINGVSVYSDHEDPLLYYYMPVQPRVRTTKDGQGREIPRVLLLKYRSLIAGVGGFLTFDVHLGLSPAEIDAIASEIKRLGRLNATPKVVPMQPVDGSVRLLILGEDSGVDPVVPKAGDPPPPIDKPFVRNIQGFGKPALFGDNGASFSVQLDGPGAALIEAGLRGNIAPAIVVYSLDYIGLRPAFSVRLNIDWDRVQTSLNTAFGNEGLFTSVQISDAVDKLVEDQAIRMEADNFVPDAGDTGKAVAERFAAARDRVQDMITDAFFTASLPPNRERPDGWDKASELITDIGRKGALMATGIGAVIGTFSYRKDSYERIDKRRLDVTISERSAVLRTVYPQGTLSGILAALENGVNADTFIREVNADDPFFAQRRIRVINRGEMVRDALASVSATLTYGNETHGVVFTKTDEENDVKWLSILENGAVRRPVEITCEVAFKPDAGGERPLSATAKVEIELDDVYEIQPAELYSRVTIPVTISPSYPWDRYAQVQLQFRYEDAANGIRTDDTVQVAKDDKGKSFTFLALDKAKRAFRYRALHRAIDNDDFDSGWIDVDADLVDIIDPFGGAMRLKVPVLAVVSRWEDIEQMFVDCQYDDDANGVHESASFTFTPQSHAPQTFVVDREDRTHSLVSFVVTTIFVGGIVTESPRSFTKSSRILAHTDERGHRFVSIVAPADFATKKLERIEVDVRHDDVATGFEGSQKFVFDKPGARDEFDYDYAEAAHDGFEWRARYLFASGMTHSTDWAAVDGDELTLPIP